MQQLSAVCLHRENDPLSGIHKIQLICHMSYIQEVAQ